MLLAHEDIVDCAVIGVRPSPPSLEEQIRAYVVRKHGSKLSEQAVKDLITSNLASYKALTGGIRFIDEIPKSPSGKILKRLLREQAAREGTSLYKL